MVGIDTTHEDQETSFDWAPWLRPVDVLDHGQRKKSLELVSSPPMPADTARNDLEFYGNLLQDAARRGYKCSYALGVKPEFSSLLERLGFESNLELVHRRIYLGVGALTGHVSTKRFGIRSIARVGRQIRNRMIEANLDSDGFRDAANVFERNSSGLEFGLSRTQEELQERFCHLSGRWGLLFLRRKPGEPNDCYVIFREYQDEKGRLVMSIEDYWTPQNGRRSVVWLLGEISIWALALGFDVIDTKVTKGSIAEQAFLTSGGVRKKASFGIYFKSLDPNYVPDLSSADFRPSDFSVAHTGV